MAHTIAAKKPISRTQSDTKPTRRVLGRGLSALIPESDMDYLNSVARGHSVAAPLNPQVKHLGAPVVESAGVSSPDSLASGTLASQSVAASIEYVAVDAIVPNPFQPRQYFSSDEMDSLAASVTEHGVLQPIIVRPLPQAVAERSPANHDVHYELVAGERRWRAAQRAGLKRIPAVVRALDDQQSLELAVIENVQRHDISAVESATAYKRLNTEFGLSQEQVAQRVGKSRVAIANTIRLLDLPSEALEALKEGTITEGHGRALLMAEGDSGRRALLRRIIRDGLTVRDVERLAREVGTASEGVSLPPNRAIEMTGGLALIEKNLQRELGARVKLKTKRRGGQILIDFYSTEDLQRLIHLLKSGAQSQLREKPIANQENEPITTDVEVASRTRKNSSSLPK